MLPSELTDKIIDCLHDDKRTLAKCGHVARSWVARSRRHLWQNLALDGSHESATRLGLFLDIIHDSPSVAVHIQHLELSLLDIPLSDDIFLHLASLPSLDTLIFTGCNVPRVPLDNTFSTTVRTLSVSNLTFPDMSTWHYFVCAFPNLQKLSLGESMRILRGASLEFRPTTKLALQRLELSFSEVNDGICMWLSTGIASATTVRLDNATMVFFPRFFMLSFKCLDAAAHLEFEGRYSEPRYGRGAMEFNLVMCVLHMKSTVKTVTVDVAANDLPLCLRTAYRLYSRSLPPLDRFIIVFHPGDEDQELTGKKWANSCALLEELSENGSASIGSIVFRAAYPSEWDEHLLAGAAPMQQFIPLQLEQQEKDGVVSQVDMG